LPCREISGGACSNAAGPSELNSRFTTQLTLFCGIPATALASWFPSISVGPSRYFSFFSWLHANRPWSATSVTLVSQLNSAKAAWQASVGCQSSALSGGVPWPSAAAQALSNGTGGAVGKAGSGLLLPVPLGCGLAGSLGSSVGACAVSEAPAVGSLLSAGVGSLVGADVGPVGCTCSAAYTARNRRTAVWPTSRT